MFTGLITAVGRVADLKRDGSLVARIRNPYRGLRRGESVACDGVCLTVTNHRNLARGSSFTVEAAPETLRRTTLGDWALDARVNLERAITLRDRLGGHLVAGHVDAVGTVVEVRREGSTRILRVRHPKALLFVEKGSLALNGVSLTITRCTSRDLEVMLIPETLKATNLSALREGSRVNLEEDVVGKYVARLLERYRKR